MEIASNPEPWLTADPHIKRAPRQIEIRYRPEHDTWATWPLPPDTTLGRSLLDSVVRVKGDSLILSYGDLWTYLEYHLKMHTDSLVGVLVIAPEVGGGGVLGSAVGRPIPCPP